MLADLPEFHWATVLLTVLSSIPPMMVLYAKAIRSVRRILREEVQETNRKLDSAAHKLEKAEEKREEVRVEVNQKLDETMDATKKFVMINERIDRHRINNEAMLKVLQSELDALRLEMKTLHQPNPMPPSTKS